MPFSISEDQRHVHVSGTAKLANVKARIVFGDALRKDFPTFYATLSSDKTGATGKLRFAQDETRAGYVAAGGLSLILYAAEEDAEMKYYKAPVIDAKPNDFITFNVNTIPLTGNVCVNVTIDNTVETVEKSFTIDAMDVATDAPIITLGGKLASGTVELYEDESLCEEGSHDMMADIYVPAGFSHAYLDIASDYLKAKGVPERVDLSNITAEVKKAFSDMGIRILSMGEYDRFSYIDFREMPDCLDYEASPFEGTFTLTVEDRNGSSTSSAPFTIKMLKNKADIHSSAANAFARSFRKLEVTAKTGKAEKFSLQYRAAGSEEWTDAPSGTVSGSTITYAKISGLTPGAQYQMRMIYGGNADNCTDPVTLQCESAAQVGNAGFEDWTTETITIKVTGLFSKDRTLDWYKPYTSDKWWDVTSKRSMPTQILATTGTSVKSFPTVAYSTEHAQGSKSAHIYTVNVGSINTDLVASGTSYAGELFIGTADGSGNHSSDGHSFASRPDKFTFKYKYSSYNNETFYVKIEFKNASGTSILSKELTGGGASGWTTYSVDLDWSDISKKASSIYICFKSASTGSPKVNANSTLEVAGNYSQKGHFGSSLYVDDIQMIYE